MKSLFIVLFAVVALRAGAAETFQYRLQAYPKNVGTCHEAARIAGENFVAATGVELVQSICDKTTAEGYELLIRYRAEKQLKLVSIGAPGTGSIEGSALFEKETECQTALASETAHFQEVTGLRVAASYCFRERFSDKMPWAMRIDGFGEPAIRPRVDSVLVFGTIMGYSKKTFTDTLRRNFATEGVDVRYLAFNAQMLYMYATILYYSAEPIRIEAVEHTKYETAEQCAANAALLGFLSEHAPKPGVSFCTREAMDHRLTSWYRGRMPLTVSESPEAFRSYEVCMAGREQLMTYYEVTLKRPLEGLLCGRGEDRQWHGILFEDRN